MKKHFQTLDSKSLKEAMFMASLGDSVILNDNLEREVDFDSDLAKIYLNNPVKLSNAVVLFLCVEGSIDVLYSGTLHQISSGMVMLGLGGSIGEVKSFSRDMKFVVVAVDESFYYPILENVDRAEMMRTLLTTNTAILKPVELSEMLYNYNRMKGFLNHMPNAILQKEIIRGYLQIMLLGAYAIILQQEREKPVYKEALQDRHQELCNRFMEEVQQHYSRERNIIFYADKLCITPKYLSQIVYKVTGAYAGDHINRMVIQEAKMLLRSHRYTVAQISDLLNFCSPSFFCRYFKHHTGITPLAFQRMA